MGKQFEKNEGSAGANIENSPLAVIIVFLVRFLKYFLFVAQNKEYNLKTIF